MASGIEWIRDEECGVAVDVRPHPVMIMTWHGTATVRLVDRYFRWSDATVAAALAAEQRLIRIADLRHANYPGGAVRKRMYEHAANDLAAEVTLANFVVVDEPCVRGVISTLRWVSGGRREAEIIMVDRMTTAFELATERLRAERIPVPTGLDPIRYEPPRLGTTLI